VLTLSWGQTLRLKADRCLKKILSPPSAPPVSSLCCACTSFSWKISRQHGLGATIPAAVDLQHHPVCLSSGRFQLIPAPNVGALGSDSPNNAEGVLPCLTSSIGPQKYNRLVMGPLLWPLSEAAYLRAQPSRMACSTCSRVTFSANSVVASFCSAGVKAECTQGERPAVRESARHSGGPQRRGRGVLPSHRAKAIAWFKENRSKKVW